MARERFPQSVFGTGDEPDARFTLANERTYLAWIRTSLALLAGGIALEVLGLDTHEPFRIAASAVLMGTGIAAAPLAWWGWARYERALRNDTPLPSSVLALPVAVAVTLSGILLFAGFLLR